MSNPESIRSKSIHSFSSGIAQNTLCVNLLPPRRGSLFRLHSQGADMAQSRRALPKVSSLNEPPAISVSRVPVTATRHAPSSESLRDASSTNPFGPTCLRSERRARLPRPPFPAQSRVRFCQLAKRFRFPPPPLLKTSDCTRCCLYIGFSVRQKSTPLNYEADFLLAISIPAFSNLRAIAAKLSSV